MKLSKVEIVNFRSIANISIAPNPTCQGFVGINESGKTNILSAISLLSPDVKLNKNDVRVEGPDEERNQDAYVKYHFVLSKDEMTQITKELLESVYNESALGTVHVSGKDIAIADFFMSKNSGLYICNVKSETKEAGFFDLEDNEIVPISWLKKKGTKSMPSSIASNSGNSIALAKYSFIEAECISPTNVALFEECTTADLNALFGNLLKSFVQNNLPNVVYWKYDDKYLLPSSIKLDTFRDNPTICVPLKSMFNLAGYHNITELLKEIQNQRANVLTNILNKVSEKSTEYLRKVWRNYKNVRFELRQNGPNIDIHIQDSKNFYDCAQRSDGFKRFVTFLLALSARVNNGEISNSIIVVDEPDLGIHILGQKNLVQELIKISKNNLVFYSTHSIFMIDKEMPSRHFIVKKKNEITTISQAAESNYTDDEVLLNALGYSIFEALKPQNIIFEGWADKRVFELAASSAKGREIKGINSFGKVHSTGVKHIVGIAKDLELASRVYCVVSDSDKPAVEKRKEYREREECQGEWYTYDDIVAGVFTLEDFIKHTAFKKSIEQARVAHPELGSFNYDSFKEQSFRREEFIKNWIKCYVSDAALAKKILAEIKNTLYSNISSSNIEEVYYTFLLELNQKLTAI